jgi:hypothetical protein
MFLILLAVGAVPLIERTALPRLASAVALSAITLLFVTSNDLSIRHLLHVDSPDFLYRTGYQTRLREHFFRRWYYRSVAEVLNARAKVQDLVFTSAYPVMPCLSGP